jgi:hypothetical protein
MAPSLPRRHSSLRVLIRGANDQHLSDDFHGRSHEVVLSHSDLDIVDPTTVEREDTSAGIKEPLNL